MLALICECPVTTKIKVLSTLSDGQTSEYELPWVQHRSDCPAAQTHIITIRHCPTCTCEGR